MLFQIISTYLSDLFAFCSEFLEYALGFFSCGISFLYTCIQLAQYTSWNSPTINAAEPIYTYYIILYYSSWAQYWIPKTKVIYCYQFGGTDGTLPWNISHCKYLVPFILIWYCGKTLAEDSLKLFSGYSILCNILITMYLVLS